METHIISVFERSIQVRFDSVVIEGHEKRVDNNAECDEQLDERVENYERKDLLELDPGATTVPDAERLDAVVSHFNHSVPELWRFLVLVCREVIYRH